MVTQTYVQDKNGNYVPVQNSQVGTVSNPIGGTIEQKIAAQAFIESQKTGLPIEVSGTMQAAGTEPYKYGVSTSSALAKNMNAQATEGQDVIIEGRKARPTASYFKDGKGGLVYTEQKNESSARPAKHWYVPEGSNNAFDRLPTANDLVNSTLNKYQVQFKEQVQTNPFTGQQFKITSTDVPAKKDEAVQALADSPAGMAHYYFTKTFTGLNPLDWTGGQWSVKSLAQGATAGWMDITSGFGTKNSKQFLQMEAQHRYNYFLQERGNEAKLGMLTFPVGATISGGVGAGVVGIGYLAPMMFAGFGAKHVIVSSVAHGTLLGLGLGTAVGGAVQVSKGGWKNIGSGLVDIGIGAGLASAGWKPIGQKYGLKPTAPKSGAKIISTSSGGNKRIQTRVKPYEEVWQVGEMKISKIESPTRKLIPMDQEGNWLKTTKAIEIKTETPEMIKVKHGWLGLKSSSEQIVPATTTTQKLVLDVDVLKLEGTVSAKMGSDTTTRAVFDNGISVVKNTQAKHMRFNLPKPSTSSGGFGGGKITTARDIIGKSSPPSGSSGSGGSENLMLVQKPVTTAKVSLQTPIVREATKSTSSVIFKPMLTQKTLQLSRPREVFKPTQKQKNVALLPVSLNIPKQTQKQLQLPKQVQPPKNKDKIFIPTFSTPKSAAPLAMAVPEIYTQVSKQTSPSVYRTVQKNKINVGMAGFELPSGGGGSRSRGFFIRGKQMLKYTPSVGGILLNKRTSKSQKGKTFTGLEIRPYIRRR